MDTNEDRKYDPNIQHGIDDDPTGDAQKGATIGGIGGAVTGLAAGSLAGPVGAVIGAVIGGVAGAAASGVAVAAVDSVDNDNTISGLGDGVTYKDTPTYYSDENGAQYYFDEEDRRIYTDETGRYYYTDIVTGDRTYVNDDMRASSGFYADSAGNSVGNTVGTTGTVGNGVPGIQTGGYAVDGTPDSRGVMEKISDTATGDNIDDKTGKPIANNDSNWNNTNSNWNSDTAVGNGVPGVQTGGHAIDGTPDTRGVMEKMADTVTGDNIDDKTGKPVAHDTWSDTTSTTTNNNWNTNTTAGNGVPGVQTGGYAVDGTPDSRGVMEKTADALTGDHIDDKTGKPIANNDSNWNTTSTTNSWDIDNNKPIDNGIPGVQTGGHAIDGTPDTRGISEKVADAVTGDNWDDKTGKPIAQDTNNFRTSTNDFNGQALDGSPDTRGAGEKVADAVTGDKYDDKTGKKVAY